MEIPQRQVIDIDYKEPDQQKQQNPEFILSLIDGTKVRLVMVNQIGSKVPPPELDSNGQLICYAPVGLTKAMKSCNLVKHSVENVLFTADHATTNGVPTIYSLVANNKPRISNEAPSDQHKEGQVREFSLTIGNIAAGGAGTPSEDDNFGCLNFWYYEKQGPGLQVELCFHDPDQNFPESYHTDAGGELFHLEFPGDQGGRLIEFLNDCQSSEAIAEVGTKHLSLSFTYPGTTNITYCVKTPYVVRPSGGPSASHSNTK